MNRRVLIGAVAAAAALAAVPRRERRDAGRLRPPMALPPGAFEQACIGCYRCAEVCPTTCIRFPSVLSFDQATPFIEASERACVLCMRCTQVCPTDALVELAADRSAIAQRVRMGTPVLNRPRCLPWNGKGNCRLCYAVCPYPDQAVEVVGPQMAPLFHPEACVGCGLCEEACPDDAHAIVIEPPGAPSSPARPGQAQQRGKA